MTKYEQFEQIAADKGILVIDYPFESDRIKGLYCDNTIALSNRLISHKEKIGVLAEEIAHHDLSVGNILDLKDARSRKQELQAHMAAYDRLIGLTGIVRCYEAGCRSVYEMADLLDVTEEFLKEALEAYRMRYGCGASVDCYRILFEPALSVIKMV